jgi:hypothetical protein
MWVIWNLVSVCLETISIGAKIDAWFAPYVS